MEKNKDFVSIIVVNWNGIGWLDGCLNSLVNQTYSDYEIILVDNASTDGSVEFIRINYPQIQLIENSSNDGFARGNNIALPYAKGSLILLINNDTYCSNNFLELFVESFIKIPNIGAAQSKLIKINDPTKMDACGAFWTSTTLLYHYGVGKKASEKIYNKNIRVFSTKGASMMIRRDVIEKIALFDEDFWCYYEETDLCNRIWLSGYECWYLPEPEMFHAVGGTSELFANDLIQFHNFKNKLLSFLKNYEFKTLLWVIPTYIFLSIIFSFLYIIRKKPKHFMAVYKAILWNIINLKYTLIKRTKIQKGRRISDSAIFLLVRKNPHLKYYYHLVSGTLKNYKD